MHVINILIYFYFIYLCVVKSVILYLNFHVVYEIHYDTVSEEEAKLEDSAEQLERLPPRRGREKRAKGPAPLVDDTQRRAKGPTPVAGAERKKEEARTAPNEAAPEPVLPDFTELVSPAMGNERVSEPEKTATQPGDGQ